MQKGLGLPLPPASQSGYVLRSTLKHFEGIYRGEVFAAIQFSVSRCGELVPGA